MSTSTAARAATGEPGPAHGSGPDPNRLTGAFSAAVPLLRHELRSPLAGMVGLAEVMLRGLDVPGDVDRQVQRRQLGLIRATGRRMLSLLDDLVQAVEIDAGSLDDVTPQTCDCRPFVLEAVEALRPLAREKRLGLDVELPDHPLVVVIDTEKFGQVLRKILHNAVTFTQSGAIVVRAVDEVDARIDVVDSGPGIPEEDRERIFAPFERGHSTGRPEEEGSGLGLYLAQALAGLFAAHVSVAGNSPAPGVTFSVHLQGRDDGAPPPSADRGGSA